MDRSYPFVYVPTCCFSLNNSSFLHLPVCPPKMYLQQWPHSHLGWPKQAKLWNKLFPARHVSQVPEAQTLSAGTGAAVASWNSPQTSLTHTASDSGTIASVPGSPAQRNHPKLQSPFLNCCFPVCPIVCTLCGETEGSGSCWRSRRVPPVNRLRLCSSHWSDEPPGGHSVQQAWRWSLSAMWFVLQQSCWQQLL